MSFKKNLTRARGHIVFVVALLAGLAIVHWLEGVTTLSIAPPGDDPIKAFADVVPLPLAVMGEIDADHLAYARIAWHYFQNNTAAQTGLAGSADNYPSTTMWETGSYLVAIIAAGQLGLILPEEARGRIGKVLDSLSKLVLFEDSLPNKAYDVRTLQMVDYTNKPTLVGLGWSALDIGRLLATFAIVERNYPELTPKIEHVMSKWDLDRVVRDGELNGASVVEGLTREYQEGRFGYEQYAAKGMMLFGYDATQAIDLSGTVMVKDVEGVAIPVDTRMNNNNTPALTTSEPYLFDGLEFGFDARTRTYATSVYRAQEMRFRKTGILTAVSEGHITEPPYFAYASVWGGGSPWAVMTFEGERIDSRRTLSTKAAFGWDALFATEYTAELVAAVVPLADGQRGWPEGIYEGTKSVNNAYTANTNAVVLAAIAFRKHGPLIRVVK